MRWLLLKDLQILRRSPLVTALLVIYPVAIAVLIGFALSRGPEKPRIAFLNEIPADQQLSLGTGGLDKTEARSQLCSRVECVDVSSEQEARDQVASGEVLAALILPSDLIERLQSLTSLNPSQPMVKVLVNEEDPVKAGLVNDRIDALVAEANLRVSDQVQQTSLTYLNLLLRGGTFNLLNQSFEVLGLTATQQILEAVKADGSLDPNLADQVDRVIRFAKLARQNLDLAKPLLSSIAHPIEVDKDVVSGSPPSLDTFAIAVAATFTLMFVTVLLVAGSLALEREENAFPRLVRGLVRPMALLAEKVGLGVVAALTVTLLMLAGLTAFVSIEWGRIHLIVLAILAGGAAFAAVGVAIGGAAKEVRASSLLAFMLSLPLAFLSLVSSGTVSPGLFHVIEVIRAAFPFDPALDAMSSGLESTGSGIGLPLIHLALLAAAYLALARLALRRFA